MQFKIKSDYNSKNWLVKVVLPNEIGLNGVANEYKQIAIDFFDLDSGQYVSSYFLSTLLEDSDQGYGLDLCGYESAWKLSPNDMNEVFKQINVQ